MALDEILSAIAKKTDEAIIAKREAQKATVAKRKQAHEETVQALQGSITDQCNQKKKAILQKAKSHAAAHIKNTELLTKQTALDTIFAATVSGFDALPEKDIEAIYTTMLSKLPASGLLRSAKKHAKIFKKIASQYELGEPLEESGFILETELADYDCRISSIVHEQMRPKTEISLSQKLFS